MCFKCVTFACCLILVLSLGLGIAFAEKEVIKFSDGQWESLWINNAIAMFIVEHGYEYPVESVTVSVPVMQQSLNKGDLDILMELWRFNYWDWYSEATASGKLLDLGTIFEKSTQGWYVPRYVIEGDKDRGIEPLAPDLKSVFDLSKYKQVFKDPENPNKGLFVNCLTGWKCSRQNLIKLHAYGLADDFNHIEPGAAPALDAAIAGAYTKGKPILAYYWEPTWLMGTYDMIKLEEPEYTEECSNLIDKILADDIPMSEVPKEAGCAYKNYEVHKGCIAALKERAPEVAVFLEKMNIGTEILNKVSAYMKAEESDADEAALWFFKNYQEKWQSWVTEDAAARVKKALARAGVK